MWAHDKTISNKNGHPGIQTLAPVPAAAPRAPGSGAGPAPGFGTAGQPAFGSAAGLSGPTGEHATPAGGGSAHRPIFRTAVLPDHAGMDRRGGDLVGEKVMGAGRRGNEGRGSNKKGREWDAG